MPTAQLWASPALTWTYWPAGSSAWYSSLRPQQWIVLSGLSAQAWPRPALTIDSSNAPRSGVSSSRRACGTAASSSPTSAPGAPGISPAHPSTASAEAPSASEKPSLRPRLARELTAAGFLDVGCNMVPRG
ncbi:hypothetical protein WMF11_36585 [Sorangium sp. So ce295]|uniref:hypothetical protein n=1 Tax=Sorangium sp. So ce295 TaxID=3133295 RepID=UPI003F635352